MRQVKELKVKYLFCNFLKVFYRKDLNLNNRQRNQTEYSDYNSMNDSSISNNNEENRNFSKKDLHTFRNEELIDSDRRYKYIPDIKNDLRKNEENNRIKNEDMKYFKLSQITNDELIQRHREKETSLSESLNSGSLPPDTPKYR